MRTTPPPCPVDDAPHTTCTSPDYVPSAPIVIVQLPCRDAAIAAATTAPEAVPVSTPPTSFTTSTYRRAVHGRKDGR